MSKHYTIEVELKSLRLHGNERLLPEIPEPPADQRGATLEMGQNHLSSEDAMSDGSPDVDMDQATSRSQTLWKRNKHLIYVLISQALTAIMSALTQVVELRGVRPFQVLFARMSVTWTLSAIYLFVMNIPQAPLGPREVRKLLFIRSIAGVISAIGLYFSIVHLPLADATVLTFLAPLLSIWASSVLLNQPLRYGEIFAGCFGVLGVLLIANPSIISAAWLHSPSNQEPPVQNIISNLTKESDQGDVSFESPQEKHSMRLEAVAASMVGVLGAAAVYSSLRSIGQRTHPMIIVFNFASWSAVITLIGQVALQETFSNITQHTTYLYLILIGLIGTAMQFFLASGLTGEKSAKATLMIYSQLVFAMGFDVAAFGRRPTLSSLCGSLLIVGSLILSVLFHNDKS